jgi:hypothetical protein
LKKNLPSQRRSREREGFRITSSEVIHDCFEVKDRVIAKIKTLWPEDGDIGESPHNKLIQIKDILAKALKEIEDIT